MFGIDFYPTPQNVIKKMLINSSIIDKVILEPSAGSGNIVDYLQAAGAKSVLACEIDGNLRSIVEKKCMVIGNDFLDLTSDRISHINMIVMNPPFSVQEKHILHAWKIAPVGCEILSLCNMAMITNSYKGERKEVNEIIEGYGHWQNFGDCFSDAERRTGIDIGFIRLFKPGESENEFEGYFDLDNEDEETLEVEGVMSYNFARDIVGRYIEAVSMFEKVEEVNKRISEIISPIDSNMNIHFGAFSITHNNTQKVDRNTFKKELQRSAWLTLFHKFDMGKYVTQNVMEKLNKYIEDQVHVPFTVKNIYLMIQMIVGTNGDRMEQVLAEAFDKICSYSDQNSTAGEKWKTNSDYKINKRFIIPGICEWDSRWPNNYVDVRSERYMDDIVKALCFLSGKSYDDFYTVSQRGYKYTDTLGNHFGREANLPWGVWHEWTFFRCRGYKKGTMHFEFLDDKLLEQFNLRVAKYKGWTNQVPKAQKQTVRKERTKKEPATVEYVEPILVGNEFSLF